MKKGILVAATSVLLLSACKKDYRCVCTAPASGSVAARTFTYELNDTKKKSAKASCTYANNTYKLEGGSCELKK
jgi:hypothetical protein